MQKSGFLNQSDCLWKALLYTMLFLSPGFSQKTIYVPNFIKDAGIDLNSPNSQWSYSRSVQTDNWVIFWEAGFGSDPSTAAGAYKVDMAALKAVAEKSFATYVDTLRMVIRGSSAVDKHKQMIFLLYSTDWAAYGSGQDDSVGTLHVNPQAANIATVVAHEIGHCFEYITGIDSPGGGYRYGFGPNASGGNGFWEQVAQWESVKTYPEQQFTLSDFSEYVKNNHLHILHETPRYANYFLPDYWSFKRGPYFMGKLWREARRPEDPVETYKRLNAISQETFNDEIFDHAARLTTWDLPAIKAYGASYVDKRSQVKMNLGIDNFWLIDPSVTLENYGYNSIKLNAPSTATTVSVRFQGKAGISGFRSLNVDKGGWRYGFVALLKDGTRVYSNMATALYANGKNPEGSLTFQVPANCNKLWLVVSGAPQEHWHHAWDDDDSNDEQWPYQVQFGNTNLLGQPNMPATPTTTYTLSTKVAGAGTVSPSSGTINEGMVQTLKATPNEGYIFSGWSGDISGTENPISVTMNANKSITATFVAIPTKTFTYTVKMAPLSTYTATSVALNADSIAKFFQLTPADITALFGSKIKYFAITPEGILDSNSTAKAPGHWFTSSGDIVAYGAQAYVYAELDINTLSVNIGQYPDRSKTGDSYTLRQALVYRKSESEVMQVNLVFQITIGSTSNRLLDHKVASKPYQVENGFLHWNGGIGELEVFDMHGHRIHKIPQGSGFQKLALPSLPKGLLVIRLRTPNSEKPYLGYFSNP